MKKKIIVSAVVVVYMLLSIFALASCGSKDLEGFSKAVSATEPKIVEGAVTMYTEFGPLTATYTATIADDGSFVINYAYDKFNQIGTGGSNDVESKVTGSVTYKDGVYSDASLTAKIPADAAATKLKLDGDKMKYTVSEDGNVLSATVKASKTKSVLGIEYASDVSFVLTKEDGKIQSLSMTYTLAEGKVEVTASYK